MVQIFREFVNSIINSTTINFQFRKRFFSTHVVYLLHIGTGGFIFQYTFVYHYSFYEKVLKICRIQLRPVLSAGLFRNCF